MENENVKKNAPAILIVDDISVNVTILENILTHEGYEALTALSVQEALELMKQTRPDLILSDLSMPEIDGLEFCRMLKSDQTTRDIPFIFITVLNTSKEKEEAFLAGAVDFIPKPFDNIEVLMRVNNHLSSYRLQQEMADYNRMMHRLVEDQKNQIEREHANVLRALSRIMKKKDDDKGVHRSNVAYNCKLLAQGMQFSPAFENEVTDEFVENIGIAARLHDVGRFLMSEEEIADDGGPNRQNLEYIEKCAEFGDEVIGEFSLDQESSGALEMTRQIARCHHARWDGSGYPALSGGEIPLAARIAAVVNDFDEMTAPRYGEAACSLEEGQKRIGERSGTYYDSDIIQVFDKLWNRMRTN